MSSVLLQKIRAAGGISPAVQHCAPLWSGVQNACEAWAKAIFDHDLTATVVQKKPISGRDAEALIDERFGFICLPYTTTGLRAIALDRGVAVRYASLKLQQPGEKLAASPALFLRLLCDHPARFLWKEIANAVALGPALPDDFSVVDPAGVPHSIDPDTRLLKVVVSLSEEAGEEDNWLLEGGEELPELHLYYDYNSLTDFAIKAQKSAPRQVRQASEAGEKNLRRQIRNSTIQLDAVLERLPVTIADCSRLEVGQVLALPDVEPGVLSVCAETMHGSLAISQAELGTWKGKRALKLTSPILESYAQEIAEI
ncbi:MAG: FliM/FliN family flagellar motor switch protein [Henriciella sp.]|uniref:FliM/FliN family flagellar motor switch protein n=1 Tax=Henriciella sp. TaxID=1968823 RepID=UPI003C7547D0